MASLSAAIDLAHAPPEHILRLYNIVLIESYRRVRGRSLCLHPDGNENVRIIVDSISRVIWRQNYKLARTLIARSSMADQFLKVRGKKVLNKDPIGFEDFIWLLAQPNRLLLWLNFRILGPLRNLLISLKGD